MQWTSHDPGPFSEQRSSQVSAVEELRAHLDDHDLDRAQIDDMMQQATPETEPVVSSSRWWSSITHRSRGRRTYWKIRFSMQADSSKTSRWIENGA
jgi:hypothetical protein